MFLPVEIEKIVMTSDNPPSSFNNIEIHLFFVLQDILIRFQNGRISKEQATKLKKQAIENYNKSKEQYQIFEYYNSLISKTEHLRIELRKEPKLETAIKLIELYSGEVGTWNLKREQS